MRFIVIATIALIIAPPTANAETPIEQAYAVCKDKRDMSSRNAGITRPKIWIESPKWDGCSKIQDDYDAYAASKAKKDADDKALIDSLAGRSR